MVLNQVGLKALSFESFLLDTFALYCFAECTLLDPASSSCQAMKNLRIALKDRKQSLMLQETEESFHSLSQLNFPKEIIIGIIQQQLSEI